MLQVLLGTTVFCLIYSNVGILAAIAFLYDVYATYVSGVLRSQLP